MLPMPGGPEAPRAAPGAAAAAGARVVLTTAPNEDVALRLARRLVESRAAACVSVVPGVTSVYAWRGRVEEEREWLLVAKTTAEGAARLERLLAEEHPYDVPECVALEPVHVAPGYLEWLRDACAPET
jgi:periplasmic divalent cation tolerance protein